MPLQKVLLVYYSRTGTTRLVAEAISGRLGCDVDEIVDTKNRHGLFGYLAAGFDAGFRRLTTLEPARHDPRDYDLVVVGTPIWSWSLSTPVRSYLTLQRGRLKNVAFFCTCGGSGSRRVFQQMAQTSGLQPVALLVVREAEVHGGEAIEKIRRFVASLTATRAAA